MLFIEFVRRMDIGSSGFRESRTAVGYLHLFTHESCPIQSQPSPFDRHRLRNYDTFVRREPGTRIDKVHLLMPPCRNCFHENAISQMYCTVLHFGGRGDFLYEKRESRRMGAVL